MTTAGPARRCSLSFKILTCSLRVLWLRGVTDPVVLCSTAPTAPNKPSIDSGHCSTIRPRSFVRRRRRDHNAAEDGASWPWSTTGSPVWVVDKATGPVTRRSSRTPEAPGHRDGRATEACPRATPTFVGSIGSRDRSMRGIPVSYVRPRSHGSQSSQQFICCDRSGPAGYAISGPASLLRVAMRSSAYLLPPVDDGIVLEFDVALAGRFQRSGPAAALRPGEPRPVHEVGRRA